MTNPPHADEIFLFVAIGGLFSIMVAFGPRRYLTSMGLLYFAASAAAVILMLALHQ